MRNIELIIGVTYKVKGERWYQVLADKSLNKISTFF